MRSYRQYRGQQRTGLRWEPDKWNYPCLCAHPNGKVSADRFGHAKGWEHWTIEFIDIGTPYCTEKVDWHGLLEGRIALRSCHGKYLSAQPDGVVVADRGECAAWEMFTVEHTGMIWTPDSVQWRLALLYGDDNPYLNPEFQLFSLKSHHGKFLCCDGGQLMDLDFGSRVSANREEVQEWEMWFFSFGKEQDFTEEDDRRTQNEWNSIYRQKDSRGLVSLETWLS